MSAEPEERVDRPLIRPADLTGPDALAVAEAVREYLRQTEFEKDQQTSGSAPDPDAPLPDRYLREVEHPATAYAGCRVLLAHLDRRVAGVVVLSGRDGIAEVARLWVVPEARGRGVGSALLDAALRDATHLCATEVRLSVWEWRAGAIGLYESRGFVRVPSWDARGRLVCMVRPL